jgi:hypothetical protein
MSSRDPCGAILQPAILSTLNAEPAKPAEKKELNHEDHEGTKIRRTRRPSATARGAGHETKSASQTQTQSAGVVCVCETLYVSLAAGYAGRRRAHLCVLCGLCVEIVVFFVLLRVFVVHF